MNFCFYSKYNGKSTIEQLRRVTFFVSSSSFHIVYGIIVSHGSKRGLLLPDLEGVDTVTDQIQIACHKAGIHEGEKIKIERFKVIRHD